MLILVWQNIHKNHDGVLHRQSCKTWIDLSILYLVPLLHLLANFFCLYFSYTQLYIFRHLFTENVHAFRKVVKCILYHLHWGVFLRYGVCFVKIWETQALWIWCVTAKSHMFLVEMVFAILQKMYQLPQQCLLTSCQFYRNWI